MNRTSKSDNAQARQPSGPADDVIDEDPSVRDHPRRAQMFPVLFEDEIDRLRRFGCLCHYANGVPEHSHRRGAIALLQQFTPQPDDLPLDVRCEPGRGAKSDTTEVIRARNHSGGMI